MDTQLNAVLLDDNISASEFLKELLTTNHPEVEIVGICERANDAILCIAEQSPNLLFLDIEMPDRNGFEFFELLEKVNIPIQCVVVSAHVPQYYQTALDMELTLYLEKPVSPDELGIVLEKAKKKITENKHYKSFSAVHLLDVKRKIPLNTIKGIVYVYPEEVLYAKASLKCTDMWIKEKGQIKVTHGITDVFKLLDDPNMFKPDRSWFINLAYLREIHEQSEKLIIRADGDKQHEISITGDGFASLKQYVRKLRLNV